MILTLEEVKTYCRIDLDYHDDDDDLLSCIESAEEQVAYFLKYDSLDDAFPNGYIPLSVKRAICMLANDGYEQRNSLNTIKIHEAECCIERLLGRYVRYCEQNKVEDESRIDA